MQKASGSATLLWATGGGPPEDGRAKGVSRSSAGAQGDCSRLWYVYFLELKNGDIYVGSTDDLRRRFASHQQKGMSFPRASTCLPFFARMWR
jgi:hypothetical protein